MLQQSLREEDGMAVKKKTKKKLRPAPVAAVVSDEPALFARLRRGNEQARDILVERYTPWVVNIARKYHASYPKIDINELTAEGNRGLLEALGRYETNRGVKFSTYAWFWIIKNVQEYIAADLSLIEVPRKISSDLKKIVASMNEDIKKGKTPTMTQLARKLDMDAGTIQELLANKKNISNPVSLDKFLDEEDRTQTIGDLLESKEDIDMQDVLSALDDRVNLEELFAQLLPAEQEVIKLRFGFEDNQFHQLREVGEKMKLSSAKVRDMEAVALIKLKRLLQQKN
jgi:RNA polymerase sigma factor (sigma-70 family)